MGNNTITVMVSEEDRNTVQRADIERSSRRDILIYLMQHPEVEISEQQRQAYQKEYDEKYFLFEQAKSMIEQKYVIPNSNKENSHWNLNYNSCEITINLS